MTIGMHYFVSRGWTEMSEELFEEYLKTCPDYRRDGHSMYRYAQATNHFAVLLQGKVFVHPDVAALLISDTESMKLCKDCKHFVGERRSPVSLCGKNPLEGQIPDPVYGDTQLESAFATRVARDRDWCGMEAKWFEPSQPRYKNGLGLARRLVADGRPDIELFK